MSNRIDSNPRVTNCTFSGNTGQNGGGILNDDSSRPELGTSVICRNTTPQVSGAFVNKGGVAISEVHCVPIPPPMPGDLDDDGDVDLRDFSRFLDLFTGPAPP